jgi:homoserine O-succinyltransferase
VLSSSPACGADVFVRDAGSPMVFLQGHPEYDQRTLLKEYRRDVLRCLGGEQPHYPTLPVGCFDAAARAQLEAFAEAAQARPRRAEAAQFPYEAVARGLTNTWRAPAARLYSNWLESLAALPRAARVGPDNDVAHRDDPAGHAELIELTDFNDLTEIT